MNKYLSLKIKIVSFVCILMVVFLNAYNFSNTFLAPNTVIAEGIGIGTFVEYFLSNGINRVAIPIFFMMSGYLFFVTYEYTRESYLYKVKSRVISLVVPYIVWNSLGMIICLNLNKLDINVIRNMNQSIRESGFISFFFDSLSFQFGFIKVLFLCTLISPLIYLSIKNRYVRETCFIALFILWFGHINNKLALPIEGILFFYIGSYLSIEDKKRSIVVKMNKKRIIISSLIWIGLIFIKTLLASLIGEGNITIFLLIIHKLSVIVGIYAFWYGIDYFIEKKSFRDVILEFAPSTFFIYCAHEPALDLIRDTLEKYICNSELFKLSTYFIIPILVVMFSIVMNKVLSMLFPTVYGVVNGERQYE